MPTTAAALVADLEARIRPLEIEVSRAWWEASTRSSEEADRRRTEAELALREVLADPSVFAGIREALESDELDPLVARQLELLRLSCLPNQIPDDLRRALVELQTSIESTYNTHRGHVDGRPVSNNEIEEILDTSNDPAERMAAWAASKEVGAEVAGRVRELARLRNQAARALGYRDFYALSLAAGELDEDRLFATLDQVDQATAVGFAAWKQALDTSQAERFSMPPEALRPWHYDDPFFQLPPKAGAVDLDHLFSAADLEAITLASYDRLGLELRPVMERSDLYAREGKSQHAFCIDIDREGDIRTLCNVVANSRWASTMLHEFGHAIYDVEVDRGLPWLLRTAAHSLTTEGVAMFFERQLADPAWLAEVAGVDGEELERLAPQLTGALRARLLVFSRWVLVMCHFERGLYADPDANHDNRWWDLVERFQLVRRPDGRVAPDWAAKIHLAVAPVYYQNYLYGELVASQLMAAVRREAGGLDGPQAGRFLVASFFRPGSRLRWDRLMESATGQPLTPSALVADLGAGA
jgi:peptidyl-dipeptidase A